MEVQTVTSLDHVFTVEPMKITSPSTDAEVALALRVLEGCCLLHGDRATWAHQHKAITVLMNVLSTRGVLEQGACLDAFIEIMLDSSSNQMDFEECNGIEEVAMFIRDKQVDENLRYPCSVIFNILHTWCWLQAEMWGVSVAPHWTSKWKRKTPYGHNTQGHQVIPGGKICVLNMGRKSIRIHRIQRKD